MACETIDVMDPVVYESSMGRLVVYQELPGLHRDKHTCIIVEMKDAEALAKQILTVAMQARERF